MKPFIKWVGGKRQLLKEILPRIPQGKLTYHEPFVGGGAVFFALAAADRIERAYLSDSNRRLMQTYSAVQNEVWNVTSSLLAFNDSQQTFIATRDFLNNKDGADHIIAASMIFLNKTCFNGLYRENSKGEINSPWAAPEKRSKGPICNPEVLEAASKALKLATLTRFDYREAMFACNAGEFVYIDPPYMPVSDTAFTAYTKNRFGFQEHESLAQECRALHDRGVSFLLSNSDTPKVRELYKDFTIETVTARRAINSNGQGRGKVNEVLIRNYQI
jgi:DNA adenine methylase